MGHSNVDVINACRGCFADAPVNILDLGLHPLANSLGKTQQECYERYPLTTAFCPQCGLFQLKETVKKEILFDQYVWVTGTSAVAKEYSQTLFNRVLKHAGIKAGDFIVEIASNDGTMLKPFVNNGFKVLGVEPAQNIADIAMRFGVNTLNAYWNKDTAQAVIKSHGAPKVIMARNVIPHVSQLHEVIDGIRIGLGRDGIGIIEFHDGGIIAKELHYDSIYHEHLCFFTVGSITKLLNRHQLFPFHIDHSPISGGSYVIYFSAQQRKPDDAYLDAVAKETGDKINELASWQDFAKRSIEHKAKTNQMIKQLSGKKIIGFGASARSATFLNFCGINYPQMLAVVDNNALKQGLFTPGSAIPIVSKQEAFALNPDIVFIIAWNFKDEIINECRQMGFKGKYLIPFPQAPYMV